jgi:hypothetical protein
MNNPVRSDMRDTARFATLLFLVSAVILFFELLSTRATKIVFSNDFGFIVIALAFLGFGLGGIAAYFLQRIYERHKGVITLLVTAFAVFYAVAIGILTNDEWHLRTAFFVASLLFYVIGGAIVSLVLTRAPRIYLMYAATLVGSAVGALGFIWTLNLSGMEAAIRLGFVVISCAAILSVRRGATAITTTSGLIIGSVLLILIQTPLSLQCGYVLNDVSNSVALRSTDNSYSHIEIFEVKLEAAARDSNLGTLHDPSLKAYSGVIDCIGQTNLIVPSEKVDISYIFGGVRSLPLLMRPFDSVFIMGSGLGVDIQRALVSQTKHITAVEINPILVEQSLLIAGNRSPYLDRKVKSVVSEGRRYLETSDHSYDLLNISNSKRYGGQGLQPYALIENYLFTEEAFDLYISKLNSDGWLYSNDLSWFANRYKDTLIRLLVKKGMTPLDHLVLLDGGSYSGLLYSKTGFSHSERDSLLVTSGRYGIKAHFIDNVDIDKALDDEMSLKITDDHPFYWNKNVSPLAESQRYANLLSPKNDLFISLNTLFRMLGLATMVLIASLIFTAYFKRSAMAYTPFFIGTGLGFMMFEIAIMQKLAPLYASPSESMALALTGILLSAGVGSFVSGFLPPTRMRIRIISALSAVLLLALSFVLPYGVSWLFHQSHGLVIAFTIALSGIPAFFLGMLFPLGIRLLDDPQKLPWVFGINGLASVIGSIAAMIIALLYNFTWVFICAAISYVLSSLTVRD